MVLDNVELKDEYDRTVTPDSRVSCNQIRTKMSTFEAIKKRWSNFCISMLNKRLEAKKNDLVTASFGASGSGLTAGAVKALDRKTNAIARLEKTIKVLSREEVPALYVKHRAIKLREKMMKNLVFNSSFGYSVGIDNYNKIFGPEAVDASLASAETPINVEQISSENQQNISAEINKAMQTDALLDRDAIQSVVNNSFANANQPAVSAVPATEAAPVVTTAPVASVTPVNTPIDRDTIQGTIDDSFASIRIPEVTSSEEVPSKENPDSESPIDRDAIENVVNNSFTTMHSPEVTPAEIAPVSVVPEATTPIVKDVVQNVVSQPIGGHVPTQGVVETNQSQITADATPAVDYPTEATPVITGSAEPINGNGVVDQSASVVTVSPEEVNKTVEKTEVSPIDYSGLEKAVAAAVAGVTVKSVDTGTDFAEEMRQRKEKYNYVPMTDDEIEESRRKLEMDKYEKIYADQWAAIKTNSDLAPKMGNWSALRDHLTDSEIAPQWKAIGDYYNQIGLGEAWEVVRNRVTNSSVNSRWDSKAHDEDEQFEEVCEHYFGATPVEWDVVRRRFQDEEILNHFDEIREYYIGIGLGEQWDTYFDRFMRLNQEQTNEEFVSVDETPEVTQEEVTDQVTEKVSEVNDETVNEVRVREPIVVVPERNTEVVEKQVIEDQSQHVADVDEPVVKSEKENELHFDYSGATRSDVVRASTYESSRTGLEALKERILKLKEEHKKSELELKAARDEQTDEARKAMEVREANIAKKQDYEASLKRLQEYCDELEEQTKVNNSSAAISRNDTACNRRFIESQTAEMHDYEDKIREIDTILSTESDEAKKRR